MTTVSNGICLPRATSFIFSWPDWCLLLKTPVPVPVRPCPEMAKSASRLPASEVLVAAREMSCAEVAPPLPHPAATSATAPESTSQRISRFVPSAATS